MWVLLAAGLNFSSFILRSLVRRRILFSKKAAYFDVVFNLSAEVRKCPF